MTAISEIDYVYRVLTPADMDAIRRERVRLIEADLYRAHLQYVEALSDNEREEVMRDIFALRSRLQPHYQALGLVESEGSHDNGSRS